MFGQMLILLAGAILVYCAYLISEHPVQSFISWLKKHLEYEKVEGLRAVHLKIVLEGLEEAPPEALATRGQQNLPR